MRHFRLNFILLLSAIIGMSVFAITLFDRQLYPQSVFAVSGLLILCLILWHQVSKLKMVVWTFARSLEARDTMIAFNSKSDDPMLADVLETFNRLVVEFHKTSIELETGKQYYDRILKIMTHEMGNSITPIIALCSAIKKHPERYQGAKLQEAIELIDSRSQGIDRFLKAYYNLTHLPEPQIAAVDSRDFIYRIKMLAEAELQSRGIDRDICRFSVSASVKLNIDIELMSQVIINLIRNALDAVSDVESPSVGIAVSMSDGHPYIIVEDNGHGIDSEIRNNLFQPFFTTKPDGTGVGLYVSRQIVRRHGGDLHLYGKSGNGTRAIIELV
ncbi:MAG: HAMP domain-containing histidine kinase [Muribaculaceae bacterium]|nr:HAMP domain-containing histidine kinase [Muribaculaceae bacterium]